jgi:hypothetical protein
MWSLFGAAFAYLILAMQVHSGFPPFYRKGSWGFFPRKEAVDDRAFRVEWWLVFGLMATLILSAATKLPAFFLLSGVICVGGALWLRHNLLKVTGGPLPWLTNRLTLRWPMLAFDIWTLGFALAFGSLIHMSSLH